MTLKDLESKFKEAVTYYKITKDELFAWTPTFREKEILIWCYENKVKLIDYDFWCRYEYLIEEHISYKEYCAIDTMYNGDPQDIDREDKSEIYALKSYLESWRKFELSEKPAIDIFEELGYHHSADATGESFRHDNGKTVGFKYKSDSNEKEVYLCGIFSELETIAINRFMSELGN